MVFVNWFAIFIATFCTFALRYAWYGVIMFGKIWKKELQLSDETLQAGNKIKIHGLAFFMMFVYCYMLARIMIQIDFNGIADGFKLGLITGLCFSAMNLGINYQYSRKSTALFFIDSGYIIVSSTLVGALIGWMGR